MKIRKIFEFEFKNHLKHATTTEWKYGSRGTGILNILELSKSDYEQAGGPLPISALESSGINATLIKKLQEAGYYTVESVCPLLWK